MKSQPIFRVLLSCIAVSCIAVGSASALQLGEAKQLPVEGQFGCAIWRPDGQGLALGGARGQGLFFSDMSGNAMMISDSPLAGWKPTWSPDGQGLAYRQRVEGSDTMSMMIAGQDGKSTQASPDLNDLFPPKWGKDGVTYRSGDELVTLDKDGKVRKVTSLSQGRGLLARVASVSAAFAMSHVTGATFSGFGSLLSAQTANDKGQKGIYVDPDNQIWVLDENGERKKLINVAGEPGYFDPVESPDGGKYAVSGMSGDLYVADPNTGAPISLGQGSNPTWSPDGRQVIFQRTTDDGHNVTSSSLWSANADGTGLTQITDTGSPQNPSWSPDGSSISYIDDGGVFIAPVEN